MGDSRLLVTHLKKEEEEYLKKSYYFFSDGAIRLSPGGWLFPPIFLDYADRIYNFEVKPTDTFILGFMKSGTTWMQEIVWTLLFNPNLDNPQANIVMDERSPLIEAEMMLGITGGKTFERAPLQSRSEDEFFSALKKGPGISPRLLKSHLPFCFLPQKMLQECKVMYVVRDVRDVLVSCYHFCKLFDVAKFTGTLEEFVDDFINDRNICGSYWKQLKEVWEKKDHPNLCFVFYEDLKNDISSELKRLDKFLGTNRTEEQIQNIIRHTSFEAMKERRKKVPPKSSFDEKVIQDKGFFRKGEVGDWRNNFTPEQVEKIIAWMAKNLQQFGNDFPYKV